MCEIEIAIARAWQSVGYGDLYQDVSRDIGCRSRRHFIRHLIHLHCHFLLLRGRRWKRREVGEI